MRARLQVRRPARGRASPYRTARSPCIHRKLGKALNVRDIPSAALPGFLRLRVCRRKVALNKLNSRFVFQIYFEATIILEILREDRKFYKLLLISELLLHLM